MNAQRREGMEAQGSYKWLALGVVVIGTFMAILDTSIVNIAIPKMMAVFGATTDQIQWVLTGYMMTMGVVIPVTGFLGDTFGTKKTYMWALAIFTLGSTFCGFAWSNSSMVAARVVQALGGGMIMPVSMAIIYQVIPMNQRGLALGLWGIAAMAAPAIGPTLSGYIVEHLDWRLIFTINIPVGVVGVILASILLREMPRKPYKGFDYAGFVTSSIGLGTLLLALSKGHTEGWSSFYIVTLFLISAGSLILFILLEMTAEDPMLDLRLLKNGTFTVSVVISCLLNIGLFGGVFLMPLFLENIRGYTAMQTGMLMFPGAIATGITMPISGRLFDKYGAKPLVLTGLAILVWTTYRLHLMNLDTSAESIRTIFFIRGVGMGFAMMPSTTAGMNTIPLNKVGRASALSNVIRQVAGSLGIAVLTTILQQRQTLHGVRLAEKVSDFNPTTFEALKLLQGLFVSSGQSISEAKQAATMLLSALVQRTAAVFAIEDTFLVTTFICLSAVPLVFFLREGKNEKQAGQHPAGAAHDEPVMIAEM